MPDLFDEFGLDNVALVKMDIEGAESEVLEHAAPFLAERKVPLWVSFHEPWWSRHVMPNWFNGFRKLDGIWGGYESVLALP